MKYQKTHPLLSCLLFQTLQWRGEGYFFRAGCFHHQLLLCQKDLWLQTLDNPRRCVPSATLGFCNCSDLTSAFPSSLPCQLSPFGSRLKPTSITLANSSAAVGCALNPFQQAHGVHLCGKGTIKEFSALEGFQALPLCLCASRFQTSMSESSHCLNWE